MAHMVDMGIVLTALGTAAWYTARIFWRTGQGGASCRGCPSASQKSSQKGPLVQLQRPHARS